MKFFNLLFVALCSVAISYGQSSQKALRTETINYKNGKATFQCYEDSKTGNLIKHGTFSFVENQKGEYGSQDVTIKGEFKDGYRNGSWTYTIKKVDAENQNGTFTTGTLTSTQNFKDGYPDGQWILNNQWKTRDRKYVDFKYVWGAYSNIENESATFTFKKGVMIGAVNYKEYGKSHTINLTQDGFATGSFIDENSGTTTEKNFNSKGVITKYVERVSASGTVLNSIDFDNELLQIADAYLNNQKTIADLDNLSIKLDTIKGIAEDAGLLFYSDYFSLPGIDGDKTITEKGNIRVHGRYLKFERIKIIPFEEHPRWPRKYSGYSDVKSKISSYNDFLKFYGKEVSKDDYIKIQGLIKEAENELNSISNQREAQEKYSELYKQLSSKFEVKSKVSKTEGQSPYNVNTHVFSRNTKNTLGKYSNNATNLFFSYKYSKSDFTSQGFKGKENDYVASLALLNEFTKFLDVKQANIDSLSTIKAWTSDIIFNSNDIECKYIINQSNSSFNTYSESNPRQTKKTKLYVPYLNVFENLLLEIGNCKTFDEYYSKFNELNDLCLFVNNSLTSKTSDIEKELKTSTDYKAQLEVFKKAIKSTGL